MPLDREEYIEQAYLFRALADRMQQNIATQDLLLSIKDEILSTTRLPMAIDFLAAELKLRGVMGPAMARLKHYFSPFQAFVMQECERENSKFDIGLAAEILHREAHYRAENPSAQGVFLFQFETLCRHRLGYFNGLEAMAGDDAFDDDWRQFILKLRTQVGYVDVADLIYVRSKYYVLMQTRQTGSAPKDLPVVLFGEKEGKVALANRRKDPLLLFAALQRHLNYPAVPRRRKAEETKLLLPTLLKRLDRLETRVKLLEDEARGGIDITKFYEKAADQKPLDDLLNLPPDEM